MKLLYALALVSCAAQASERHLAFTVQDLSASDGEPPSLTVTDSTQAACGELIPPLMPELDPRNGITDWHFGRNMIVSPRTRLTVTFTIPAYKMALAYGYMMVGRNGQNYDDYIVIVDASTNRITLVMSNTKDTPACASYHWRFVPTFW